MCCYNHYNTVQYNTTVINKNSIEFQTYATILLVEQKQQRHSPMCALVLHQWFTLVVVSLRIRCGVQIIQIRPL